MIRPISQPGQAEKCIYSILRQQKCKKLEIPLIGNICSSRHGVNNLLLGTVRKTMMTRSDSLWILAILPLLAESTSDLWFLQPPSRNQVLNGTETRIHCQLHNKAEQVSGQSAAYQCFCTKLHVKYWHFKNNLFAIEISPMSLASTRKYLLLVK